MPVVEEVSMQQMFQCYHQNRSHMSSIELYSEFEQVVADGVDDVSCLDVERQTVLEGINPLASQHPFGIPSCMRQLDLVDINAPDFPEFANIAVAAPEDGEFMIGM
ncbi:hypothetical protein PIB30_102655 [Stylosanthes scabra]|uniref:Uncharacterized protein n=1 Tax=Stylosanthes scabra TaxID=79078 RepID=A0ABU6WXS0_9FABA|nr:hypothetical protein [Stylosanthes scabra]